MVVFDLSVVASVVRHLPLVLEVPGLKKNFGVRTRFLQCHLHTDTSSFGSGGMSGKVCRLKNPTVISMVTCRLSS